jgi:hypothetical protein
VSADERPKCGQPTKSGSPCGAYADLCRHHGPKAAAAALPAGPLPAKTSGPGNPHDPAVKEAAAVRLARGEGVSAVAAALGLPHQTVSDWKRGDHAFRDDVRRLRGELLDELSGTMAADGKALWATVKAATRGEVKVPQGRLALDALKAIPAFREAVVLEDELDEMRRKLDELTGDDDGGW